MTEYEAQARTIREKTARLKALRLAKEAQARIAPTAIANSCRQRYPTRVINFIQTRILITHHSCCRAGRRNSTNGGLFRFRNAMEEGYLATKANIRAMAKALCFRACTDCKSADECDPDKNWIEEALAILERPGPGRLVNATKSLSILGARGW